MMSTKTPFWFRANQFGTIPQGTLLSMAGIVDFQSSITPKNKDLKLIAKGNFTANYISNSQNKVFLSEAYVGAKFRKLLFYVGRKHEQFGLADSSLTSGSFIWSGNALPIPKIQLQISEYLPIPINSTNSWLAIKGNYAHGWFGEGKFAYGYFLHQKTLYLRLGKTSSTFKVHGGFNHQVQWGGKTFFDIGTVNNKTFPASFRDYLYVVTGMGGFLGKGRGGNSAFDSTNRVGNHLGSIDIGLQIDLKKYSVLAYRQSIYEDGSLYYLINIADGLNGIAFTNLFPSIKKGKISIHKVVVELLNSRSQGGNEFIIGNAQKRGKDDYFNHQQYYDGWSYRGQIIGTPFITTQSDTDRNEPHNGYDATSNNRVLAYYLGIKGNIGASIQFTSRFSYTENLGTYNFPYEGSPKQFSALLQFSGIIKYWTGLNWTASMALDNGELYQNSIGGRIGISKKW